MTKQSFGGAFQAGALGDAFAAEVNQAPLEQTPSERLLTGTIETARAEIENREGHERQIERHEDLWRRERQKIATASDPHPGFDLGSRGHRNIERDYRERRSVWEQKRDEIDNSFIAERENIRTSGQTLSGDFSFVSHVSAPEPAHAFAAPSQAGRDVSPAEDFAAPSQGGTQALEFAVAQTEQVRSR